MTDPLNQHRIPLSNGQGAMPAAGFGTLIPDPVKAHAAVASALQTGFRHLDCAERYGNEAVVGAAMREAFADGVLRREDLFVTSKLWNTNHRPDRVEPALDGSLRRLGVDWLDCYLIHTPFAFQPGDEPHPRDAQGLTIYDTTITLADTWRAMERLVDIGKVRAIGLSDIGLDALKSIVAVARIRPAVVQIEAHPYLPEWEMLEFCQQHGIVLLAFAPLGHAMAPRVTDNPIIGAIARRTMQAPAQVALAWAVQRGTAFLTTSTSPVHIAENFDFSALPDDALRQMREEITTEIRFNSVVATGVPGFIPRPAL